MKSGTILALFSAVCLFTAGKLQASAEDGLIREAARNSYVFRTFLKNDDVSVQAKEGVITLSGSVADVYHRLLASETIAFIPGISAVEDSLEIKKKESPALDPDGWLAVKIKTLLFLHSSLNPDTRVRVYQGAVNLRGEAWDERQKELTGQYIGEIPGVKEVKNEMSLVQSGMRAGPAGPIDDASVSAQVKLALLLHPSAGLPAARVSTENGQVKITGRAKSRRQKEAATSVASDIAGVKKIINDLEIQD